VLPLPAPKTHNATALGVQSRARSPCEDVWCALTDPPWWRRSWS